MSGAAPTVGVVSARALRGEAVARVLEQASIEVRSGDEAAGADVLVLVDADAADWIWARKCGRPTVAVVTESPSGDELLRFVEDCAVGVLPRACEPRELVETVTRVAAGESGLTSLQARLLVEALQARSSRESHEAPPITRREHEILAAIEAGLSVKETARRLQISPRTVENTQRLLFRKLGVRSRSQAVARALESGLLGSSPRREHA